MRAMVHTHNVVASGEKENRVQEWLCLSLDSSKPVDKDIKDQNGVPGTLLILRRDTLVTPKG